MDHNAVKGLGILIFFLLTIGPGLVPILLFSRCKSRVKSRRGQLVISYLNCFAGGVFLSTCLMHLLAEGFEEYEQYREEAHFDNEYPFFHLGIAVGIFLVALVERLAAFLTRNNMAVISRETSHDQLTEYREMAAPDALELRVNGKATAPDESQISVISGSKATGLSEFSIDVFEKTGGRRFFEHSGLRAIVLLLALSFHTVFDGLAVGLQETETDAWLTIAAISIHKTLVAVSLGLELATALQSRPFKAFFLLFVFALMAPIGIAIGMGVTSSHENLRAHLLAGSVLQAVATGSFLYVTFFEILNEELGHDGSVLKIFVTAVGFSTMALAKIWDND